MHSSVVINLGGIFGPVWLTDQCLQKMTPPTSDFLYLLVKSAQIYLLFTLLIHWHIYHSAQKLRWFGPMNDQRYLSGNTLHKKQLIVKVAWAESWASWCPPAFLYALGSDPIRSANLPNLPASEEDLKTITKQNNILQTRGRDHLNWMWLKEFNFFKKLRWRHWENLDLVKFVRQRQPFTNVQNVRWWLVH